MDLQERLQHLDPSKVRLATGDGSTSVWVIEEHAEDGQAKVRVFAESGQRVVGLRLEGDKVLGLLQNRKNADGYLLMEEPTGTWVATIIECKRTLNERALRTAVDQLRASFVRLQLLADFLGVPISRRVALIATTEDRVAATATRTRDPVLLEQPIQPRPPAPAVLEWRLGQLSLVPFEAAPIPLRCVQLEPTTGEGDLTPKHWQT